LLKPDQLHLFGTCMLQDDSLLQDIMAVITTYLLAYEVLNPQPLRTDIKPLTNMITY
jgi:hypothetical protein